MKRFNIWLIFGIISLIAVTCASQWNSKSTLNTKEKVLKEARDTLKLEDLVLHTDQNGIMYFNTSITEKLPGFTGDSMFINYGYLFDIGEHNEMQLREFISDYDGYKTFRYNLYHKGIYAVFNAAHFVEENGRLTKFWYQKYDINVDINNTISIEKAIKVALNKIDAESYAWENEFWEKKAKDLDTTFYPSPKLVIKKYETNYKLIYDFIVSVSVVDNYIVQIDAKTGELIRLERDFNECTCNSPYVHVPHQLDINYYNSPQTTTIQRCNNGNHLFKLKRSDIRSIGLAQAINVPPSSATEICWTNPTSNNKPANTAFWATQYIYDYFQDEHSYVGYNNNNGPNNNAINLLLMNAGSAGTSISSIGASFTLKVDLNNQNKSYVTLDAIGHEFTHAIDRETAKLNFLPNFSEGRIIMEGFCDIFGVTIKSKFQQQNNYRFLEQVVGSGTRLLNNPSGSTNSQGQISSQPDTYQKNNWHFQAPGSTNDNYFIHHNNGIMNYWFYLLCEGGSGTNDNGFSYNISKIGMETAAKIAFLTLTDELGNGNYGSKDFQQLRKATLAVAKRQPWGICSKEWETVRKAWDAVGVTGCDWDIDLTTQCNGKNCIVEVEVCGTDVAPLIKIKQGSNLIKKKKTYKLTHTINNGCNKNYRIEIVDKSNSGCEPPSKDFTCDDSGNPIGISPCEDLIYTNLAASGTSVKNCTTGGILLSVSGGIPSYGFQWSNGSTSQNLMNVTPGTYSVTITDACSDEPLVKQFTVVSLPTINTAVNITKTCISTSDGAIHLTVSNAKQPYSYNWSNGATTEDISNLPIGTYTVTITDGNECQKVESFTVNHFPDMQLTFSSFEDECQGQQDGMIDLSVQSGTAPYTYQWSNGSTSQDLDNLSTGTYSVTCTDFHGCQKTASITLSSITPIVQVLSESCQEVYYCKGEIIGNSASLWQFVTEDCSSCQTVEYCSLTNSYRYLPGLPYTYDYFDGWGCYEVTECTFISGNVCTSSIVPQGITTNYIPQPNGCPYGQTLVQDYCGNTLIYQACVVMARISDDSSNVINGTINAYPNPFNSSFNLSFETTGNSVNILIHNLTGQKIYENVVGTQEGTNDINIAIQEQIADGVYLVSVIHEDGSKEVLKVVKQNN